MCTPSCSSSLQNRAWACSSWSPRFFPGTGVSFAFSKYTVHDSTAKSGTRVKTYIYPFSFVNLLYPLRFKSLPKQQNTRLKLLDTLLFKWIVLQKILDFFLLKIKFLIVQFTYFRAMKTFLPVSLYLACTRARELSYKIMSIILCILHEYIVLISVFSCVLSLLKWFNSLDLLCFFKCLCNSNSIESKFHVQLSLSYLS